MEVGENDKNKVESHVPWLPTTPMKPIVQRPVPIYTPLEGIQMGSHGNFVFPCFESSGSGSAEIHGGQHLLPPQYAAAAMANIACESAAAARLRVAFDNIPGSSNGFAELLASTHSHGGVFNHQFAQDPLGTSCFAYYANATPQVFAPASGNGIRADTQDAGKQLNMEEKDRSGEETNVPTAEHNNNGTLNKELCDPSIEFSAISVSTPCKENHSHNNELGHIDLNETPQQAQPKPPRRRKHRPKVVREDKPKTSRAQVAPKPVQSKENPTGKRKYVRKKESNTAATPQTEATGEWIKPVTSESGKRTCRRPLSFEIGEQQGDENSECREITSAEFGRETGFAVKETHDSNNKDTQAPNTPLSESNLSRAMPNTNRVEIDGKGKGLMIAPDGNENRVQILPGSDTGTLTTELQVVGSKRNHSGTIEYKGISNINQSGTLYNYLWAHYPEDWVHFPNIQKKKRSEKGRSSNTGNTSSMSVSKGGQVTTCLQEEARLSPYASSSAFWSSGFEYNAVRVPIANTATRSDIHDKLQSFECDLSLGKRTTKRRSAVSSRKTCVDPKRQQTCMDALVTDMGLTLTKKKRTKKRTTLVSSAYTFTNEIQQCNQFLLENNRLPLDKSLDVACEEIWKNMQPADALSEQFRCLNINRDTRELVLHGQNALVPYNQQNQKHRGLAHGFGTIVPYGGSFDPIKKQRPRPKVDLDEETTRVWKLLMLDINSHGIDGMDEEKTRWWEEERNVFRGRADSFIARMHLVQGDRRFSPWKGSVVDSVVGVFLTQNVSDHLSSSAFMSLAALFPLKSSNKYNTYHEESTSLIVNKPQGYIVELDDESTKLDQKILSPSAHDLNSMTTDIIEHFEEKEAVDSNDSCRTIGSLTDESNSKLLESTQRYVREQHSPMESGRISAMIGEGQESSRDGGVREELNDMVSSQCSVITSQICEDFSVDQSPEKIGSCSESNSGEEDLSCSAKYNIFCDRTSFSKLLEMAGSTTLREVNSQSSKSTEPETQAAIANSQSMPSQLHLQQQSSDTQQNELQVSGQTQDPMQKARESDFGDKNSAINESSEIKSAPIKHKSRDSQKVKKDNFDWDSLRIQAQAKVGKREKTEKTMDSVNWDAVRCADVKEIANAIKERGMNNMLAERIKNFLNLLVDKHGGIDLEWLRDVPPDQAKEYLLSIKGLGLKSVECVRLLTLHNLAFPVDTNVGRIAVRLGWVPIQPLPESLQLHLLELYPVLESIQKYLWPRLCKLDSKTLYELHYQLITFGKVFCTKLKPNCNACPMRGECRHFASAFASARLALPAPEQRSIVLTNGNNATHQNPPVVIPQLPLPLPANTTQAEELQLIEVSKQFQAKPEINISQPIIEEPSTPEPECSQVLESDMEDTCFDESCELPYIRVDLEELTHNVQKVMKENMELQDGEMSRALVALTHEAACIPTPKLKNVNRLRTEHWVYELPDTHPLLEGWEKREPDDPGKYLLAIWTPGETASSTQPPERKCSSRDCGQLCNEEECFPCNSFREENSQIVRGTILIPCRTAMRGSFPLNGTYFQVNEVFADNESSLSPISVPRSWIWNLTRRTVYFGTSVTSIFRGLTTQEIQLCFWKGYVCVRGFDRETRAPRPLKTRFHCPPSRQVKKDSTPATPQGLNLNLQPNPEEQPELLADVPNREEQGGGAP